jgi:hypothetical protein
MHKYNLRHGDLKLENILITHVSQEVLRAFQRLQISIVSSEAQIRSLSK